MQRSVLLAVAGWLLVCLSAISAQAQVPTQISYQGRLLDAADVPISGSVSLTFRIFDDPSGGSELWSETHPVVEVSDGLFKVSLGEITPLSADVLAPGSGGGGGGGAVYLRYLEIQVGADTPITPRTLLTSAPYSVATTRVAGDVSTSPGELHLSDLSGSTTATIRASSDPGGNGSELVAVDGNGSTTATIRASSSSGGAVLLTDSNGDASTELHTLSVGGALVVSSGGELLASLTGADTASTVELKGGGSLPSPGHTTLRLSASPDAVSSVAANDIDNDGFPDVTVTSVCGVASADVAIKTKGTGADPNRVTQVSSEVDDSTAQVASSIDLDGDGTPEIGSECAAIESRSILKQYFETGDVPTQTQFSNLLDSDGVRSVSQVDANGDGNAEARVTAVVVSANPEPGIEPLTVSFVCDTDSDDDGVTDNEASLHVTPTTSAVAIKTKGTGADNNRTSSISSSTATGEASTICDLDDDGDGIPDTEYSLHLTPTTTAVAIKTKGTGANDNGRASISSSTATGEASTVCDVDDDGDGIPEG
ncbi:MAG: hypothetical protein ABIJ61_04385, partial [bacterium]